MRKRKKTPTKEERGQGVVTTYRWKGKGEKKRGPGRLPRREAGCWNRRRAAIGVAE